MRTSAFLLHLAVASGLLVSVSVLEAQAQSTSGSVTSNGVFEVQEHGVRLQYPPGWSPNRYANVNELLNVAPEKLATLGPDRENLASIDISVIRNKTHAEALHRLRVIARESNTTSTYLTVGGWPALLRREVVPKLRRGTSPSGNGSATVTMVTIAVAADNLLVRFSGYAPQDASGQMADQIESIGRTLRFRTAGDAATARREVEHLRASPPLTTPMASPQSFSSPAQDMSLAAPRMRAASVPSDVPPFPDQEDDDGVLNLQIFSEPEIAVSTNGNNIVVAQGCSFQASNNGGTTFAFGGGSPGTCTGGDSSVAFGQSGNFYWATIGSNNATCPAASQNCNNTQQMTRSTNNGQTFTFQTNVIDCRVTAGCGFGNVPDQEHIGADRTNAAPGGDQVYLVFRKGPGYGISCSQDSGANWTAVAYHTGGSIDFPRIAVSQNGTVYVLTRNGNNINIDSFSSCANGLVQNLNQVPVATFSPVVCPVPGLDRCNSGNVLSSPSIAVDDTNANHLYVTYASNTSATNENVFVIDSTDGGATWRTAVQINAAGDGRRYLPWVCSVQGTAYVSWFDRRNATAAQNDLTDFYGGSASLVAGNLTAGTDFVISGAADPQCASGWACVPRATTDSESCSVQPQLAGVCCNLTNDANCASKCPGGKCVDSGQRCDFTSGPACPNAGETCNPDPNGGCPKYGDYNGNTCQFGRFYTVWPSATNQPGALGTGGNINLFYNATIVHAPPVAKCKDVQVSAGATCTASASIDNGSNDPDGDPITTAQSPPGPYPLGDTTVTLTVTDSFNVQATCQAKVTVVDNTPPVVTCPTGTTASADNTCHAGVPDVLGGVTITDNCPGPFTKSQNPTAGTPETLGVTNITVNVKDASGNPATCSTTFTVVDTTPPVVSSSVATSLLWPPSHDLQNVGLAASATDNCTANPTISVKGILSTEPDLGPDADSNFSPDAKNIGVGTLRLRSERPGSGQRIYLNVVQAKDASGNVGYSCTTDVVPQSQSAADKASVQAAAAAAQAYCNANNGAAPPGFVPVGAGPVVGPKQ